MRRILACFLVLIFNPLLSTSAFAQFEICNGTFVAANAAMGEYKNGNWVANGWWIIEPGQCAITTGEELGNRYYYLYANRMDGAEWNGAGSADSGMFCGQSSVMNDVSNADCTGELKSFQQVDTGDATYYTYNLSYDNEPLPRVETVTGDPGTVQVDIGVLDEQCLFGWESSHQVHSTEMIIELDYQAVKTTMKRLDHCLKLTTTGPIEIGDLGQEYIQGCIDYAINDGATVYLVQAIIALGVDILSEGATGGGATAAVVASYVAGVGNKTVDCLTDTERVGETLSDMLKSRFDATIEEESHWVFWEL